MIPLPETCFGCPFYDKAKFFTPDKINPNGTALFIGQNPGELEEQGQEIIKTIWQNRRPQHITKKTTPQPLIGTTGQMFNKKFLPLTGLYRKDISLANAIRCRPYGKNELPEIRRKDVREALMKCRQYLTIPERTKIIVTLGSYALYQLTGQTQVIETGKKGAWRGYAFSSHNPTMTDRYVDLSPQVRSSTEIPIFSTMHIAALYRGNNKKYWHATLQDFHKIRKILSQQWPQPLPNIETLQPSSWPNYAAFDTEYTIEDNTLIRWSMTDTQWKTYVIESHDTSIIKVPEQSVIILQNALADIDYLKRIISLRRVRIEDTMIAHSVLWTGEPHSLNYMLSVYGSHNRHKHLSSDDPVLYAGLDAYGTLEVWKKALVPDFKADRLSWEIYKKYRLPLLDIIAKSHARGIPVDHDRLSTVKEIFAKEADKKAFEAKVLMQNPDFNIGSQIQIGKALHDDSDDITNDITM